MNDGYDSWSAARQDLELLCTDLIRASALLEELATAWRRDQAAGIALRHLPLTFPVSLQASTLRLVDTLRALVDEGPGQPPGLAFSAVAQLAALLGDVTAAAEDGFGHAAGRTPDAASAGLWASIENSLNRAGKRQWSLISHLVTVREWSWTEQARAGLLETSPAWVTVTFADLPAAQPGAQP
jgi:hypothetical protein